jgi:hypothetical protein
MTATKRPPRDYAREPFGWYREDVREECAHREPATLWIWPILRCMGKEQSHEVDNPHGWAEVSVRKLAQAAHLPGGIAQAELALEVLAEAKLIEIEQGRMGMVRVRDVDFNTLQVARGSNAERQQHHRDRNTEIAAPSVLSNGDVTASSRLSHQTETREDQRRPDLEGQRTRDPVDNFPPFDPDRPADSLTITSRQKIKGPLPENIDAAIERLIQSLPDGEDSRKNLFALAHQGATEADVADAMSAVRELRPRKPAAYACTVLSNRINPPERTTA